jgi:hypothetical protein
MGLSADNVVGGVAIEDAASIAVLFPHNTPKDEVPERLALYEKIRMGRAHKIQELTRLAGTDLDDDRRGQFNSEFVPTKIMPAAF